MRKTSKISSLIILAAASIALTFGITGCNNNNTQDTGAQNQPAQVDQSQDPAAAANLAAPAGGQATGTNDRQGQNYSNDDYDAGYQDASYGQPVLQASEPPPPLPEYSQSELPGDGYLWTPGYWGYSPQGYYWVPGAWARPPEVGLLWTPGYWGYSESRYRYHNGFWGRHIGYYGGVNYGFGYVGTGYQGGYWNGDRFNYNRSVNNVTNVNVTVYNRMVTNTVINNTTTSRASYNGPGGITRRPLPAEIAGMREQRVPPMTTQLEQQRTAAQNRQQFASVNNGRPAIFAAAKPIPEGKPIAPVIPARPAAATPNEPTRKTVQPEQPAAKPGAPPPMRPTPAPAPLTPNQPTRKTVQPEQPAAKPGAPPPTRPTPAPAPPERRAQPLEPAAHPQPSRPIAPPPAAPKPAPKPEARPATPPPPEKQVQHPAPEAKPKSPPPPAKKEPPDEKPKPE